MNILDYLGNFHPLIVHLPVGILSLFVVLTIFLSRAQLQKSKSLIRLVLLLSALSATASTVSGLLIANAGEYDNNLVTSHQVMGIILTLFNWSFWYKTDFLFSCKIGIYRAVIGLAGILLTLTGHAGGSLTHGSDFLIPPPMSIWFSSESADRKSITLESRAYEAATAIFQEKCQVCHGKNKQKGKLRLDSKESILVGGKNGDLITENATSSLLIERLLLPIDDEDHMPPKEKKQLNKTEIDFLIWWIEAGTNFENTLAEMNLPDSLHDILTAEEIVAKNPLVPDGDVQPVDSKIMEKLTSLELIVIPIADGSNYLSVSFINVRPKNAKSAIHELASVRDQLIWLNLDYQSMDSDSWNKIGELVHLRKLSVRHSNISDITTNSIALLSKLAHLNLVGTGVTVSSLKSIESLENLKTLFIYQTKITSSEINEVMKMFPEATIEYGNYSVPTLQSDTTVFTVKDIQ